MRKQRRNRKMLQRCGILCLLMILLGSTMSCGQSEGREVNPPQIQEDRIQIGMSFDSFVIERWIRERDVFVSVAKELGAEVNVQNANGNLEEQKNQIEYFIEKGLDVIVIVCTDSEGLTEQVKKAREKGIKVIAYDRLITDVELDLYISFDNEMVGNLMAEELVKAGVVEKSVLMLGGPLTDHNVSLVEGGFRKVMEENSVTILDSVHADSWRAEIAAEYIYNNVELVDKADAIMCGNDNIATQVASALAVTRLAGDKPVVGQDADLEACQRIVEGTQLMTVYKPVEKLARQAAVCAVKLAKGEALEEETGMIESGSYQVPYVRLEPIAVTKENMNEVIIESGFHRKEDVYRNLPGKEAE